MANPKKLKTFKFNLEIGFSETVSEKEAKGIAARIVDALRHECDAGVGLAPNDSESYTNKISLTKENDFKIDLKLNSSWTVTNSKLK